MSISSSLFSTMSNFAVFKTSLRITKIYALSGKLLFMKFAQRCWDLIFQIHFLFVTFFSGAQCTLLWSLVPNPFWGLSFLPEMSKPDAFQSSCCEQRAGRLLSLAATWDFVSCGHTEQFSKQSIWYPFLETTLPENMLTRKKQQGWEKQPKRSKHLNKH